MKSDLCAICCCWCESRGTCRSSEICTMLKKMKRVRIVGLSETECNDGSFARHGQEVESIREDR